MIPFYKSPLTYIVIGLFLSVAVIAQAQFWTPPPADFPAGNVYVPVTTGSSTQYKQGTLRLDYLQLSTSTGVGQNAITFPYNRGIAGFDASGRAQSIIYPYAGAPWGLFLSNRNTAGSGGVITLLSTQAGSQSRLQLYPDGRITTIGTFVLPNTATTSLPATARVPGAMVYTNGAPYFYKNATEGWLPIGSGAGGGGAGWTLTGLASNPLLYTTATTTNVGIGTINPTEALEVRGNLLIDRALVSQSYPTGWYYKPISSVYGSGNVVYSGASNYQWWLDAGLVPAGSTWDSVKITNVNTGSGVGGVKLCEDSTMDNAQCGLPADGYWDASASGPDTVYDLYKFVDPEDTSGTAYVIAAKRFQKTRSTIMPGGNLRVTGWVAADGGIDNPATLVLTAGWHALRWRGSSQSIGDIKLTINSAQGSASNNVVGAVYFITNSGAYTAALPDSQIVQPGTIFALRLTARKLPRLPAEIASEWTLNTGSLTIGNVTADSNSISAPMVKGTTGLCIGADCRIGWPAGGSGSGVWSTSTMGGIIYYNGGPVGIGTANPGGSLGIVTGSGGTGLNLSLAPSPTDGWNNGPMVLWDVKGYTGTGSPINNVYWMRQEAQNFVFNTSNPNPGTNNINILTAGSDGKLSLKGTGSGSQFTVNSADENAFSLKNDAASVPVVFKAQSDGGLVVANATDTLFIKNGKVAIGGNIGIDEKIRLEVAKGDLKVSADFSGPSGYLYEKQSGATGSGYLDGWVSNSIFPRCIDSTSQCATDMSYKNGESDCGDKFYAKERLSVSGDICYNWTLAKTSGSSGTAVPVSLIYKLQSNTPVFTGGGAQFDNSISIGGNTSVSGFAPAVTLSPGGGSGNYTIRNTGGNLGFVNASNDKRITLRQDGMLNLNVRQDTDYGYGLLVTADGASINRTKALAVNTTLDASDRFVVYGNGDVRTKGSLTLGENLGSVARNTVISSKIYTLPVDFASAPTWKNIDGTNQRGMYFIAVNGMTNNLGSVDDNGYPVGLWACSASTFSGNRTCTEITKKNGYGTSPSTGSCDGQIVNLIWPDTGPIQISTTQPGNACTSDPGRTVPVNMRFNVSVVSF